MSEAHRVRVLLLAESDGEHGYAALAGALLRRLSGFSALEVDTGGRLDGHDVVLAAADRPLDRDRAEELAGFLRRGGGLVGIHQTLAAWGMAPEGEQTPITELRVHALAGHPLADRLDEELRLRDALPLIEAPPEATVLATVSWHYGDRPVAYARAEGAGRIVHLGLGHTQEAWAAPAFAQLVHRCLRHAADLQPAPPVGVGLYGYGAIGREHAEAAAAVAGFELRGICDRSPARRDQAAAFGVKTYAEGTAMLADPAVDLVVVGLPPVAHTEAVLEALAAGKHVVCEKPFALHAADCDRMLEAAARAGRTLTVYQSRRWDPDFVALRNAVEAGAIGDLFYMESFIGGFSHPCTYWHSHESISGGTIFDWGSHYFDWMLTLFREPVAAVAAHAHKRVWHDVTNADQVGVAVTFADGKQASFLQSDIAAALKPKWYLLGTAGAITGDWRLESVKTRAWTGDLVEEELAPAESPATVRVHRPNAAGGAHQEVLALEPRVHHGFYRNLGDHLVVGEPLAVPATEARRNIAVMEAAARSIAAGKPVELSA
ncbi:MAG TPA: Gfo/Idh/MocA family oxidoreductase [Candidatus Dormibacteraeota bacterium]